MKRPMEGDVYRTVSLHGKTFELKYGYYEEYERESRFGEPIPIYPDFLAAPEYTDEGRPFVTQMQSLCEYGESSYTDGVCADCLHFEQGEDLIGICLCDGRRQKLRSEASRASAHPNRLEDKL